MTKFNIVVSIFFLLLTLGIASGNLYKRMQPQQETEYIKAETFEHEVRGQSRNVESRWDYFNDEELGLLYQEIIYDTINNDAPQETFLSIREEMIERGLIKTQ